MHPDLYHMLRDGASDRAKTFLHETSVEYIDCVHDILVASNLAMYAWCYELVFRQILCGKQRNFFSDELLMNTPPISEKYTFGIVLALTHFVTKDEDPIFCWGERHETN